MIIRSRKKALWRRLPFILGSGLVFLSSPSFAAGDAGGKPERTDIVGLSATERSVHAALR
jgi:hypothetical protein